jgi:hypothetical protein
MITGTDAAATTHVSRDDACHSIRSLEAAQLIYAL